jgi:hypothetical protein
MLYGQGLMRSVAATSKIKALQVSIMSEKAQRMLPPGKEAVLVEVWGEEKDVQPGDEARPRLTLQTAGGLMVHSQQVHKCEPEP